MKRVCSWCQKDLGEKPDTANPPEAVTDGICEDCRMRVMDDLSRSITHERPRPKGEPPLRRGHAHALDDLRN